MIVLMVSFSGISNKLEVLQWNCGSINTSMRELGLFIEERMPHVILLQETWLKRTDMTINQELDQYTLFRADRDSRGGGVVIAIRDDVSSRVSQEYAYLDKDVEVIVVRLNYGSKIILIANVYMPKGFPARSNFSPIPETLLDMDIYIGGDFNSRHPSWENDLVVANCQGTRCARWIEGFKLMLANDGAHTRFRNSQSSALDLSICSEGVHINDWRVLERDIGRNDHRMISWSFEVPVQVNKWNKTYINQSKVLSELSGMRLAEDHVDLMREFYSIMNRAKYTVKKSLDGNFAPWFDTECKSARRELKAAKAKLARSVTGLM
jgi:hypothetical protein